MQEETDISYVVLELISTVCGGKMQAQQKMRT